MVKSKFAGHKLDQRKVVRALKKMYRDRELRRLGKLEVLLSINDVAFKFKVSENAIRAIEKKYYPEIHDKNVLSGGIQETTQGAESQEAEQVQGDNGSL